jgi:hypothetical protein
VQGVVPQTVDIVEEPVHGHPLAAVIQVLVCVMTPHDPHVSLQVDGALHVDQTPSDGQHPVGRQPEVTGVRSA